MSERCKTCGKMVRGAAWNGVYCDRQCEIVQHRRQRTNANRDRADLQRWQRYRRIKARQQARKRRRR